MTASGVSTMAALGQVRVLFEEVAKLLGTADSMIESRGWKRKAANTVTAGTSAALYAPRRWMPHTVFRFYGRPDKPNLLAAVAVLLGVDQDTTTGPDLPEPMVCALLFDYGIGNAVGNDWKYDFAAWHVCSPDATFDGRPTAVDPRSLPFGKDCKVQRMWSLAVPLMSITDSAELERLVVAPLVTCERA